MIGRMFRGQNLKSRQGSVYLRMTAFIGLMLSACESPRVIERYEDRLAGRWQIEIEGAPDDEKNTTSFRMVVDVFDSKVVGVMVPSGNNNTFPICDVFGSFSGDKVQMDRFLRGEKGNPHGLQAGAFSGVVSEDGSHLSGTFIPDKKFDYSRRWIGRRL